MDTGCYAAVVRVVVRCAKVIGLIWARLEWQRLVLQRVIHPKTDSRAARAPAQRLACWRVCRFRDALNDSAAALSALVPTAPRERVTPS